LLVVVVSYSAYTYLIFAWKKRERNEGSYVFNSIGAELIGKGFVVLGIFVAYYM